MQEHVGVRNLRSGTPDAAAELQRARAELRALERRFSGIVERTADGIIVVGPDGTIRFANRAAGEIFGRSRDALVGSPFGHPLVAGERAEIDVVRDGGSSMAELRSTETEWDGEPATIVSIRDITDRKQAEEQARRLLREQVARAQAEEAAARSSFLSEASRRLFSSLEYEATLQNVVSLAAEGFADFCVLDTVIDGTVRRYTATVGDDERALRLQEVESYPFDPDGDSPQARVFRDQEPLLVEEVDEAWLRSATRNEEHFEIVRSLGVRSLLCVPVCAHQHCLGVFMAVRWRDQRFTDRDRNTAAELGRRAALAIQHAQLYQKAEAGNRAKTDFLSVMSHELRTPLSAILGYSDLLIRDIAGPTTDAQKKFLGRIRASSNHLLQIIEEILAFASSEAGADSVRVRELSLQELVEDVLAVAEPLAETAGLPLNVDLQNGDAMLRTDSGKLRQVLVNLLANAFKFTREGEVRLEARVEGVEGVEGQEAVEAVFVVSDTGIGIPEDKQEHVFERFWQVEDPRTRQAGGTGLGLSVARSFTRLLGGDITLKSVPGDGSAFTVRLPVTYEEPEAGSGS